MINDRVNAGKRQKKARRSLERMEARRLQVPVLGERELENLNGKRFGL